MEIGKEEIRLRKGVDTYLREGSFGGTEKNVQVMMEWEREYMYACVDSLNLSGKDDVLEIGFGNGLLCVKNSEQASEIAHNCRM